MKTVIAEYNFKQHEKGNIKIDVEQIGSLGVSGIPTLVKLSEDENQAIADEATYKLIYGSYDIYENVFSDAPTDEKLVPVKTKFYEKNISWIKAKESLDEFLKNNPNLTLNEFDGYYYETYMANEDEEVYG